MGFFTQAPLTAAAVPVQTKPYGTRRAITASARKVDLTKAATSNKAQTFRQWQTEAWMGFDQVGEIHFGFTLLADTFSRIRLYAAEVPQSPADMPSPLEENNPRIPLALIKDTNELLSKLVGTDFSSQARAFALNMAVAGECLLAEIHDEWVIKSTFELLVETDKIRLVPEARLSSGNEAEVLAKKKGKEWDPPLNIGRIWRQHPRHTDEPDSSLKALGGDIEELLLLGRLIRTVTRARLNAGIVFVPDGITVMGSNSSAAELVIGPDGLPAYDAAVEEENAFISELVDMMTAPITDENSTSSVVPSVMTGAGELGAQIRHITFDRKVDEWLVGRVERLLERIMQGIDVPKDIVQGLANVKYSNAIVIDNNFWKSSIEPLALMYSDALTEIYLREQLKLKGYSDDDVQKVCIWYDPSEIVTNPDQSGDADTGYDKMLINGDAWRRAHGFGDGDAPNEQELAIMLLMAKGQLPEDVVSALLKVALPTIMKAARSESTEGRVPESAEDILNPDSSGSNTEDAS